MRWFLFSSSVSCGQNDTGQGFHRDGKGLEEPQTKLTQRRSQGVLEPPVMDSPQLIVAFSGILQAGY